MRGEHMSVLPRWQARISRLTAVIWPGDQKCTLMDMKARSAYHLGDLEATLDWYLTDDVVQRAVVRVHSRALRSTSCAVSRMSVYMFRFAAIPDLLLASFHDQRLHHHLSAVIFRMSPDHGM